MQAMCVRGCVWFWARPCVIHVSLSSSVFMSVSLGLHHTHCLILRKMFGILSAEFPVEQFVGVIRLISCAQVGFMGMMVDQRSDQLS